MNNRHQPEDEYEQELYQSFGEEIKLGGLGKEEQELIGNILNDDLDQENRNSSSNVYKKSQTFHQSQSSKSWTPDFSSEIYGTPQIQNQALPFYSNTRPPYHVLSPEVNSHFIQNKFNQNQSQPFQQKIDFSSKSQSNRRSDFNLVQHPASLKTVFQFEADESNERQLLYERAMQRKSMDQKEPPQSIHPSPNFYAEANGSNLFQPQQDNVNYNCFNNGGQGILFNQKYAPQQIAETPLFGQKFVGDSSQTNKNYVQFENEQAEVGNTTRSGDKLVTNFEQLEISAEDSLSANDEALKLKQTTQTAIGGRSSTTKGESTDQYACPFVVGVDETKSDNSAGGGGIGLGTGGPMGATQVSSAQQYNMNFQNQNNLSIYYQGSAPVPFNLQQKKESNSYNLLLSNQPQSVQNNSLNDKQQSYLFSDSLLPEIPQEKMSQHNRNSQPAPNKQTQPLTMKLQGNSASPQLDIQQQQQKQMIWNQQVVYDPSQTAALYTQQYGGFPSFDQNQYLQAGRYTQVQKQSQKLSVPFSYQGQQPTPIQPIGGGAYNFNFPLGVPQTASYQNQQIRYNSCLNPQLSRGSQPLLAYPHQFQQQQPQYQQQTLQQPAILGRTSGMSQLSNNTNQSGSTAVKVQQTGFSSEFVESFKIKMNSQKDLTIVDIQNHMIECALDQQCSRFIQQRLEQANDFEKALLFDELQADQFKLMKDVFGNYVIQKMFEYGNASQRQQLFFELKGKVYLLSLDQYGCRVVQKALEVLTPSQREVLVNEIRAKVNECVEDSNGNHVIQKIVESIDSEKVQFIIDAFKSRVYEMSVHQYGCRVIQRMLEHCREEQIRPILDEVFQRVLDLTKDQFGNYVITHVLEHGKSSDKEFVLSKMKRKVLMLSLHKFGSNVIEKCLQFGEQKQKEDLMNEVIFAKVIGDDGSSSTSSSSTNLTLNDLIKDKYGNYVIQRVLDVSNEQNRKILIDKIYKIGSNIKKQNKTHARHVFNFLEKNYNIVIPYVGNSEYEEEKKEQPTQQQKQGGQSRKSIGNSSNNQQLEQSNRNSDFSTQNQNKEGLGLIIEQKQGSSVKRGSRGKKKSSQKQSDNQSENIFEKAKE